MSNQTLQNDKNNRVQESKKALESALHTVWLAVADTLRTASADFDTYHINAIKELLLAV